MERIYSTLVASASSILHRFAPYSLSNGTGPLKFESGRAALPGATSAQYDVTTNDPLARSPRNGGLPQLYFADVGSLFNHFLGNGGITDDLNLQCFLRPKGSCATPAGLCSGPTTLNPTGSCRLCGLDNWSTFADGTASGPIPPTLVKLLEVLGDKFHVPPALILSTMWHEGAFSPTSHAPTFLGGPYQWTEANVENWVNCGVPLPNCPSQDVTWSLCGNVNTSGDCVKGVIGTGQIPGWFWGYGGPSDPWAAVLKIDPSRTRDTINPCNLLDSLAGTAQELEEWSYFSRTPNTCYGFNMTNSAAPQSCTDPIWTRATLVQSRIGHYVGTDNFCPDGVTVNPPGATAYPIIPTWPTTEIIPQTNEFSCIQY